MRRVHAEHHSSFVLSTLRTTFALDIPPDASPAFQINIGESAQKGGLEWRVRLCLLVAVASESSNSGTQGVRMKHLVRDGPKGEWGSSWKATRGIAPMERPVQEPGTRIPAASQSWTSFFATAFLGVEEADNTEGAETEGQMGIETDYGGGEDGWVDVRVETVECEVPIKVWPGNTAFKAMDVVFDV
jgi:RAB6A-GEF complex partner protein 2